MIAAYRIKVQGWSPERAYREMLEHGFREVAHFRWKDRLFAYAEVVLFLPVVGSTTKVLNRQICQEVCPLPAMGRYRA